MSRFASSSSISVIFISNLHNSNTVFITHPHADCTGFSRAVKVEQKARLVPRLELPPHVVSPAARENGGHKEMATALTTVSCSQLLKILPDTPAQSIFTGRPKPRFSGHLSPHPVHAGPLHQVVRAVAGGAAAALMSPAPCQHGILVTVKILHQPKPGCFKTTIYCITPPKL